MGSLVFLERSENRGWVGSESTKAIISSTGDIVGGKTANGMEMSTEFGILIHEEFRFGNLRDNE